MRLSKTELARAFQVSTNTIYAWTLRGCPCLSAGRPGTAAVFSWRDVERWCYAYKIPPNYQDPDSWIGTAFHRAKEIVSARPKKRSRK
jgi:hypothetical protein